MILQTDYKLNAATAKSNQADVYAQIIKDLVEAEEQLSDHYVQGDAVTPYSAGSEERVRPVKSAATAFLARVYLYGGDFEKAELKSSEVLNNTLYQLVDVNSTFLKNNREAIWQLMSVNNSVSSNTGEGKYFILQSEGPGIGNPVTLKSDLINSFEGGDLRLANWTASMTKDTSLYYYSFKYKVGVEDVPTAEYSTVLRLAEIFLIRSEARAQLGDLAGSAADLNAIRSRAGLPNTTAASQIELLEAILHERKVELFTEWGHRWLDLIRTGNADAVLSNLKGPDWQSTDKLFPIPQTELEKAGNLAQNPGY